MTILHHEKPMTAWKIVFHVLPINTQMVRKGQILACLAPLVDTLYLVTLNPASTVPEVGCNLELAKVVVLHVPEVNSNLMWGNHFVCLAHRVIIITRHNSQGVRTVKKILTQTASVNTSARLV